METRNPGVCPTEQARPQPVEPDTREAAHRSHAPLAVSSSEDARVRGIPLSSSEHACEEVIRKIAEAIPKAGDQTRLATFQTLVGNGLRYRAAFLPRVFLVVPFLRTAFLPAAFLPRVFFVAAFLRDAFLVTFFLRLAMT